ncbi:MAG: hypothetical protein J6B54_01000, partial [Clostridia bacterium]|nr:hypothetical protein [Clostridia bacterium]
GTNQAGEKFRLSNYIMFGVVEGVNGQSDAYDKDDAGRAEAIADVTDAKKISAGYTKAATMNPNGELYLALVVYMPTDVNNVANHNGTDIPQIDLGINVLATQFTKENDSFNDQYDADAVFGTYVELEADGDLLAAMASAEKDLPLTIKLMGNVEWPTEGHHGENNIIPASSIVIDGNGYTITATGSGVTPLGDVEAPMTLKNVTIVDNSASYNEGAWELTYLEMGGTALNCNNVTFADEIQLGTNATFTNCTFESNEASVYSVWVEDGSATFTNCTFTGYRGLKVHEDYGSEVSAVVVKDCLFGNISKKPGIALGRICMNGDTYTSGSTTYTNTTDTTVSITGSSFVNCQAGDQGKYVYETDTDVTTFNFKEENNTVLNDASIVSTKDELLAFSAKALTSNNNVAEEATIVIGADIDMAGAEFSAIIAQRGDKLTVVGNGHKISNAKIVSGANDNTTGQASMFYAYPNSTLTVSNLTIENAIVTADANGSGYAAAVVGYAEGNVILNNVDVVNATVTGVKSSGMMVGHLSGSLTATDCALSGTVTLADFAEEANGHYAGKYVGTLAGTAVMTNCTVDVTVSGNLNAANIGEVYGRKTSAGSSNVEFAKDQTALNAAINGGSTNVILGNGDYVVPSAVSGKTVTITGNGSTVIDITTVSTYAGLPGATITFENLTIKSDPQGAGYNRGFAHTNKITYNDCVINGTLGLNTDTEFNDCTFNISGDYYNLWTWGAPNVALNDCTFNSDGKALLLYGTANTKLTVNGCIFNDNGGLTDLKAAIEIGNDYGKSYELIVNNTVVNGYEINDKGINTGSTLWANKNSMGQDKLNVVVDGVDVY